MLKKVPVHIQIILYTVLSKCKVWPGFLQIKTNKKTPGDFLKLWFKGFYSQHSKFLSSMFDPYILNAKDINKLHVKLAKQATKLSTPSYLLFSLLCGLLPEWSDVHLKPPQGLGEISSTSTFFNYDINLEFEKAKIKYGLTDEDFILDTRGEPGNSKSITETAQ